ncbi:MAG: SDR family oxidoreductase [Acholeplasmataceae bacterium]
MTAQTFLITGGSNGIGRYLVKSLVNLGHHVIFIDCDEDQGLDLMAELDNHLVTFIYSDLKEESAINAISRNIADLNIKIDTIIHNAMISKGGIFDATYEDFIDVMKVGLAAPFYLTKILLPYLNNDANIINMASTRAFQSQKNTEAYSAAKGGLIALTHALSVSLAGVARVNSISPGWIDTHHPIDQSDPFDDSQHPSKRRGIPQDILKAVLYISDKENTFLNGENITIDGGMSKVMIYHKDEGWKKDL